MNILFISMAGDALSIAQRVQQEGHNSLLYICDKQAKHVGDRMVEKPHTLAPVMTEEKHKVLKGNVLMLLKETQPDLVVFDMVKMGEVADYVKEQHIPVFGACKWADYAELDRDYGYKLMKSVGIKTPVTYVFNASEREKAISMVEKSKKRYVYKPSGNIECSHTYVSKGTEDMVAMLKVWSKDGCEFELQEYIEGVLVSAEIWWNGQSAGMHNWTMEEKKFMAAPIDEDIEKVTSIPKDGVGSTVGCAGDVVSFLSSSKKLVKEGIGRMERLLKKTNYRGPIDLNSIVTKEGIYGLEFTIRLGYDAVQPLLELYKGSITSLLYAIATGSDKKGEIYGGVAIGVRISIPPYPHTEKEVVSDIPIIGTNAENLKHIWWADVKAGSEYYESAGVDGNLGCVTAKGSDVRECRRRVYRTISNLTIPQLQYRTDIGNRVDGDVTKLKDWGYL